MISWSYRITVVDVDDQIGRSPCPDNGKKEEGSLFFDQFLKVVKADCCGQKCRNSRGNKFDIRDKSSIIPSSTLKQSVRAGFSHKIRENRLSLMRKNVVCESYFKNFFIMLFSSFGL